MAPTTERPRRRRIAISLRASMLLVLVVAVPMGWRINRARVQRQAVEALRSASDAADPGGFDGDARVSLTYDFEDAGAEGPPGPGWLRRWIGDEYFQEVTAVEFPERAPATPEAMAAVARLDRVERLKIADPARLGAGLARLRGLGRLRELEINGGNLADDQLAPLADLPALESLTIPEPGWVPYAGVGDAGVGHIARIRGLRRLAVESAFGLGNAQIGTLARSLPRLEVLEIPGSSATDAGMPALLGLRRLKRLNLARAMISPRGLDRLSGLPGLESLDLSGTTVDDRTLAALRPLRGLREIGLYPSRITDAGLAYLAELPNLEKLAISSTRVTDAGLAHVGTMRRLKELTIDHAPITDAAVPHLVGLPALEDLGLYNPQITDAGLALIGTMPKLKSFAFGPSNATPAGLAAFARARGDVSFNAAPGPPVATPTAPPAPSIGAGK